MKMIKREIMMMILPRDKSLTPKQANHWMRVTESTNQFTNNLSI